MKSLCPFIFGLVDRNTISHQKAAVNLASLTAETIHNGGEKKKKMERRMLVAAGVLLLVAAQLVDRRVSGQALPANIFNALNDNSGNNVAVDTTDMCTMVAVRMRKPTDDSQGPRISAVRGYDTRYGSLCDLKEGGGVIAKGTWSTPMSFGSPCPLPDNRGQQSMQLTRQSISRAAVPACLPGPCGT